MTSPLKHARRELDGATAAFKRMKEASSLDDFESAWRSYLASVNRVWSKLEALAKKTAGRFQPWLGERSTVRKEDMLLRYLLHARNSDEHTLTEVVERRAPSMGITAGPTGAALVRSLRIRADGTVEFDGEGSLAITFRPERVVLARVLDRGEWYDAPTHHLDRPLLSVEPLHVAELGLRYYTAIVEEADRDFFGAAT